MAKIIVDNKYVIQEDDLMENERIALPKNFSFIDGDDWKELVKSAGSEQSLLKDLNLEEKSGAADLPKIEKKEVPRIKYSDKSGSAGKEISGASAPIKRGMSLIDKSLQTRIINKYGKNPFEDRRK